MSDSHVPAAGSAPPSPSSLLALMLFPVYWMLNISLQSTGGTLATSFFPTNPSLDGYRTAIEDQGRNLVTSLIIAVGTVVVTLLIAAPAAYALAQFRFRWINWALLGILISQMIPGDRDRQRPLHASTSRSACSTPSPA